MSHEALSGGIQAIGQMKAAKAQQGGLNKAKTIIAAGLTNDEDFRKSIQDWTTAYRHSLDEVRMRIAKGEPRAVAESQEYRDASGMLTRNLAAAGSVRSGAAVQGYRDLAAEEADRAFQREAATYQLFGDTVARGDALTAALLGREGDVRTQLGGLEIDKGAVEAARLQDFADTAATVNQNIGNQVQSYFSQKYGGGAVTNPPPGSNTRGGYGGGGGGLQDPNVQSGAMGAGGIGGGQSFDLEQLKSLFGSGGGGFMGGGK